MQQSCLVPAKTPVELIRALPKDKLDEGVHRWIALPKIPQGVKVNTIGGLSKG
jgi:hypothetical protein